MLRYYFRDRDHKSHDRDKQGDDAGFHSASIPSAAEPQRLDFRLDRALLNARNAALHALQCSVEADVVPRARIAKLVHLLFQLAHLVEDALLVWVTGAEVHLRDLAPVVQTEAENRCDAADPYT